MIRLFNFLFNNKTISAFITLILFLLFYSIRFFVKNPTISTTFNSLKFISYSCILIYLLIAISILLNDFFPIIKKHDSKLVSWVRLKIQKIGEFISKKSFELYEEFFRGIFEKIMLSLTAFLLKTARFHRTFHFIFISIPTLLLAACYFIDIVIYKEFYYFPRYLILCLVPLLFSILIRCLHIETLAAIEPLDKNARFYHSSSTDLKVRNIPFDERKALFDNAYHLLTLVMYAEDYCRTLLQGYPEQKVCLIIRHSLFLISIFHLIYYMF